MRVGCHMHWYTINYTLAKYVSKDGGSTLKNVLVSDPYKQVWQFVSKAATK